MSNRKEMLEIRDFKRELYAAVFANDSAQLLEAWYGPEGGREVYLLTAALKIPKIKAAIHKAVEWTQEENASNQE
tara:strand:+ start:4247 stop:4471 length:225 start_codon:yes stop_codon:yes gene_type:complete